MSDLGSFIIEQNRVTHDKIDALSKQFNKHVETDQEVHEIVRQHERYVRNTFRALRWASGTAFAALLAWLGIKL